MTSLVSRFDCAETFSDKMRSNGIISNIFIRIVLNLNGSEVTKEPAPKQLEL